MWRPGEPTVELPVAPACSLLPSTATDARHGLVKVAANLKGSGERYGYALHLLVYHLETCGQLHMDIMCKWRPWLQRAVLALLQEPPADASAELRARIQQLRQLVTAADNYEGVRMVLSNAHGTLHSLHCQVLQLRGYERRTMLIRTSLHLHLPCGLFVCRCCGSLVGGQPAPRPLARRVSSSSPTGPSLPSPPATRARQVGHAAGRMLARAAEGRAAVCAWAVALLRRCQRSGHAGAWQPVQQGVAVVCGLNNVMYGVGCSLCCPVFCTVGSSDQLHKGALHFNRNKVKKQAHSLVGRQQKFRELLPKAEAKLAAQLQHKCSRQASSGGQHEGSSPGTGQR